MSEEIEEKEDALFLLGLIAVSLVIAITVLISTNNIYVALFAVIVLLLLNINVELVKIRRKIEM